MGPSPPLRSFFSRLTSRMQGGAPSTRAPQCPSICNKLTVISSSSSNPAKYCPYLGFFYQSSGIYKSSVKPQQPPHPSYNVGPQQQCPCYGRIHVSRLKSTMNCRTHVLGQSEDTSE